jgi:GTPase SAR1 family protein
MGNKNVTDNGASQPILINEEIDVEANVTVQAPAQVDSTTVKNSIHYLEGTHRILLLGGSRVGKSSIINLLLNSDISRQSLQTPAKTADSRVSNGTTDNKVTAYISSAGPVIIDTVGLTDPRFTQEQIINNLYQIIFNFRIGISLIILVIKHDIFTEEEQKLVQLYRSLIPSFFDSCLLVVTHYDNPVAADRLTATENYLKLDHSPAYKTFLDKFPKDRIIVGTLQVDVSNDIDQLLNSRRKAMKDSILNYLNNLNSVKLFELNMRNFNDFVSFVWAFFKLNVNEGYRERLLRAFVNTNNTEQLQFMDYTCTICTEKVDQDVFVSKCVHVFHFDCIRVWLQHKPTCPNCTREIIEFVTHKGTNPAVGIGKE